MADRDPGPAPAPAPRREGRLRAAEGILRSLHTGGGARAGTEALRRLKAGSTGRMRAVPASPALAGPSAPAPPGRRTRPRTRPGIIAAAAAALLALGLAGWLVLRPVEDTPTILETAGDASLSHGGRSRAARPAGDLPPDTTLRLRGPTAYARLAYADGTEIELRGEGEIARIPERESHGKGLRLARGLLAASVRPQPRGCPFHVFTPAGRVDALGTRLTVAAAGKTARLDVQEGRARFTREADGKTVEVGGGAHAVSLPGRPLSVARGGSGWWNASWSRRRRIALEPPPGAAALVDFPLLVVLTPDRIDYTAAGGEGRDVRFVGSDGRTVLAHEIERWDAGGTSFVWVRLPRLGPAAPVEPVWMYYGNPRAKTPPPGPVWDDAFRFVYHLGEVAGTAVRDASPRGRRAVKVAAANPCPVAGKIGGAQAFDGLGDSIDTHERENLPRWTIEAWVRGREAPKLGKAGGPVMRQNNYQLCWDHFRAESVAVASLRIDDAWRMAPFGPMAGATWYYLAATFDGSTLRAYRDGALVAETPAPGVPDPSPEPAILGRHAQYPDAFFRGTIDEVRLSAVARPDAWIAAQHRSMTGGLAAIGPEEARQADGIGRVRARSATPAASRSGCGLRAAFFADRAMTDRRLARIDPAVDFFWEDGIPYPLVPELFTARWTGTVTPRVTGEHVFTVLHDDGARLWVDGRLLFDSWKGNMIVVESRGRAALTVGKPATIRLELFNGGGRSVAKLLWTPPGGEPEIVPPDCLAP
jgi:ferric-dicitrate binding protein FerR (iron transport regulator)